ncbi:MAG: Chromosome segregation ATPase [candidate division CPR2 bacterium GW2011_GWC1_39_9]|uniref:Chromosome segregation ATPase n=1 Tax=candidate division CPR2 bacterium GW2011_GWC2_39_10 TaxID=1618345 RepID=A0A0G0LTK9_UNCC2|nr:MAG: Chromosome segregation ATPase [candidate division CPR2 bacterium GW2011_GWC2_39_10]KKR34349.1 MAG: Chromosome segregation ATPase [candidate division CPR2 bacterium GW2011_GWC1_39_9]
MITIALTNQKGGVGKTTTAINLAAYMGKMDKRILLIDLDPQANSSSGFGIDKRVKKNSLYEILTDQVPINDTVLKMESKNVYMIPSDPVLAAAEVELVSVINREFRLKKALESVQEKFDYCIIDCPPSLSLLTINGLVAADKVIIPVQSEYYALEGLGHLLHTIDRVKMNLNPYLDILGIVLTMYDYRTVLSHQVKEEVRKHFLDQLFDSVIPRNIRLAEAPSHGKSILQYDRFCKGASAYKNLAKEVIKRCQKD